MGNTKKLTPPQLATLRRIIRDGCLGFNADNGIMNRLERAGLVERVEAQAFGIVLVKATNDGLNYERSQAYKVLST